MRALASVLLGIFLTAHNAHSQVSNNMTLLDQWNPDDVATTGGVRYNDIWGYTAPNGREYAIVGSARSIHIVDVTDPTDVVEVDRINGGQGTIWRDFKTYQDRIYAVSDNTSEGLIIMDASFLPDSVHVTYQSEAFFSQCHNIFIDEEHGRMYVAGSNTENNGLIVLGLNGDLDQPTLFTSDALPGGYVHDLYVNDHIVYASHGFNGLYIYDYSSPTDIKTLASIQTNGYNHSSWLTDDCRYLVYAEEVPAGIDMGVVNVTNLLNGDIELEHLFKFPLLGPQHTNVTPHNPYIRDTMLVVSYYEDGTQVFNIGDPLNPQPYAYYDTHSNTSYRGTNGNWGTYPYLPSGNIISSDIDNGLFVLSIDDYDMAAVDIEPEFPEVAIGIDGDVDNCGNEPIRITATGGYQYYQWYNGSELIPNATTAEIEVTEPGLYQAIGLQGQKQTPSQTLMIEIAEPVIPNIDILGETLVASPSDGSFRWLFNNTDASLSDVSITPKTTGYYQVERTDDNGCVRLSDSTYFFVPKEINLEQLDGIYARYLYDSEQIELSLEVNQSVEYNLNIFNVLGQTMHRENLRFSGFKRYLFDRRQLATGIYYITVDDGNTQDAVKIYIP